MQKNKLFYLLLIIGFVALTGFGCAKDKKQSLPQTQQTPIPQIQPKTEMQTPQNTKKSQNQALRTDFISFQADLICEENPTKEKIEEFAKNYGFSTQILNMVANEFKDDPFIKTDIQNKAKEKCPGN